MPPWIAPAIDVCWLPFAERVLVSHEALRESKRR